jgi:hypothetical protein
MTAILLAALLAGAPPAASARPRVDLRVSATDAGGATDVGLADALARTMAEAGLTASPAHRSGDCDECVHVSVRKVDGHEFVVEVRTLRDVARVPVRVGPTASSFDQVNALAIEAELLAQRMRPVRRKQVPKAVIAAAVQPVPAPSSPAEGSPEAGERPPRVSPFLESSIAVAPAPAGPLVASPVLQAQAPVPPSEQRLALNVAATVLSDTVGGLRGFGPTIGLRLRATRRLDVRASAGLLHDEHNVAQGGAKLDVLPFAAGAAVAIPRVPSLSLGAGVEALLVAGARDGREAPRYWSFGQILRLEHRYAVRSFALLSSLQVALHPASWNTAGNNTEPFVKLSPWTIGASLGLEFTIF